MPISDSIALSHGVYSDTFPLRSNKGEGPGLVTHLHGSTSADTQYSHAYNEQHLHHM